MNGPCNKIYKNADQATLVEHVKINLIDKIKATRLEKDISQDELARRIGVTHSMISKMESKYQISIDNLILIYEALDLDFNIIEEIRSVKNKFNLELPSKVEHRHTGRFSNKGVGNE